MTVILEGTNTKFILMAVILEGTNTKFILMTVILEGTNTKLPALVYVHTDVLYVSFTAFRFITLSLKELIYLSFFKSSS